MLIRDQTCGVEGCLHAKCNEIRARIEDLRQEIAYTEAEINEQQKHLKQCQDELYLLGVLSAQECSAVAHFSKIPQVSAIYMLESQVWVFNNSGSYDDSLMDTLLWVESNYLDEQQNMAAVSVRHVPDVLAPTRRDVVGTARLIYERKAKP